MKNLTLVLMLLLGVSFAQASIESNLKYGQSGNQVSELQDFLNDRGFLKVPSTGFFGLLTLKAVQNYQTSVGVPSTGYVGVMTRGKINDALNMAVGSSNEAEIAETGTTTIVVNPAPQTPQIVYVPQYVYVPQPAPQPVSQPVQVPVPVVQATTSPIVYADFIPNMIDDDYYRYNSIYSTSSIFGFSSLGQYTTKPIYVIRQTEKDPTETTNLTSLDYSVVSDEFGAAEIYVTCGGIEIQTNHNENSAATYLCPDYSSINFTIRPGNVRTGKLKIAINKAVYQGNKSFKTFTASGIPLESAVIEIK